MGQLKVLSKRGHDLITWDDAALAAGDATAQAAVREAERVFAEHRRTSAAFAQQVVDGVVTTETADRVTDYDPRVTPNVVIVPMIQGG